ncbi:Beta-hexosaminidase, partial [Smittium mucronatum]
MKNISVSWGLVLLFLTRLSHAENTQDKDINGYRDNHHNDPYGYWKTYNNPAPNRVYSSPVYNKVSRTDIDDNFISKNKILKAFNKRQNIYLENNQQNDSPVGIEPQNVPFNENDFDHVALAEDASGSISSSHDFTDLEADNEKSSSIFGLQIEDIPISDNASQSKESGNKGEATNKSHTTKADTESVDTIRDSEFQVLDNNNDFSPNSLPTPSPTSNRDNLNSLNSKTDSDFSESPNTIVPEDTNAPILNSQFFEIFQKKLQESSAKQAQTPILRKELKIENEAPFKKEGKIVEEKKKEKKEKKPKKEKNKKKNKKDSSEPKASKNKAFSDDRFDSDDFDDSDIEYRLPGDLHDLNAENMDFDDWKKDFAASPNSVLNNLNELELKKLKEEAKSLRDSSEKVNSNTDNVLLNELSQKGSRIKNKDLMESKLFGSDYDYDYNNNFGLGLGWDSIFDWRVGSGLFNNQTGFNNQNSTNLNGSWNNTNSNININQIEIIADKFSFDYNNGKIIPGKSAPFGNNFDDSYKGGYNYGRIGGYNDAYGLAPFSSNSYSAYPYYNKPYDDYSYSNSRRLSRTLDEAIEYAQNSLQEEYFNSYDVNYEIIQILSNMTLKQKIFQRIMPMLNISQIIDLTTTVGSSGFSPSSLTQYWNSTINPDLFMLNSTFASILMEYGFGGIILSNNSTISLNQTVFTIANIKYDNYLNNTIPLFIGEYDDCYLDDSLGFGTIFPSDMSICSTCNRRNAHKVGERIGMENKYLGLNFNTATSCNVSLNSTSYPIGVNHCSSDPFVVTKAISKKIFGIRESGTIAGVRGFPGIGDARFRNSTSLPYSRRGIKSFLKINLIPYINLINKGIDVIDVSSVQIPALSDYLITNDYTSNQTIVPAVLSRKIITKLLRAGLGYRGIVELNANDYNLLSNVLYPENIISNAFRAGVDIIQLPINVTNGVADYSIFDSIYQRIGSDILAGNYTVRELNRSVMRILRLKFEREIMRRRAPIFEKPMIRANLKMKSSLSSILSQKLYGESITLLKNDYTCGIPFDVNQNSAIAIFMPDQIQCDLAKNEILALGITANITTYPYRNITYDSSWNATISNSTHVIIGTECYRNNIPNDGFVFDFDNQSTRYWNNLFPIKIIQQANLNNICVSTLLLNTPYCAPNFSGSNSILAGYGRPTCGLDEGDSLSISGLIGSVFGFERPRGVLPVNVFNPLNPNMISYPIGFGLPIFDDDLLIPMCGGCSSFSPYHPDYSFYPHSPPP